MSLTINQQPSSGYVSAFNPIDFLVSTDNIQPIFEYQIRPKVNGLAIANINKPKSINGGKCWFDAQRVIQNLLSYDITGIANNTLQFYLTKNVHKEFVIEFAEFSGTDFLNVASGSPLNSNTYTALNTAFDYLDTSLSNYMESYIINGSFFDKQFLTGLRGANIRIRTNDSFELGMATIKESTAITYLEIKTYNSAGVLLGTYNIENPFVNTTTLANCFLSINVGTSRLNSQGLTIGSQPIITDSVHTYQVYTVNGSFTRTSEILTFEIDRSCLRYTPVRVFWLNKLGRIDSFNMNLANDKSFEVAKSYYQKEAGAIVGNSIVRSPYESGDTAFNTKIDSFIKLRTDYISEIESTWLSEFVKSPIAWMFMDNKLTTIKVNNSNYTIKNPKREGLFIDEFDVQLTNSSYRQRL